jgi:hypothetical protein
MNQIISNVMNQHCQLANDSSLMQDFAEATIKQPQLKE